MAQAFAGSRRTRADVTGNTAVSRRCRFAKRTLDVVAAAVALIALALPMLVIAAAIRLTGRGPAIFRQTRVGLHGKQFVMLKFRTMRDGSSDLSHRDYVRRLMAGGQHTVDGLYKLAYDPRVTRVGAVLRRTSMDELPQLFNVLRGDMALVGPRPVLPWELTLLPSSARPRFDVRPGLTGLWQVSGRNRLTMSEALELDVRYATRVSIWQDLKILARTIPALLRGEAR
jgi:lipopolysaccharide/colanic/teichoic acid biosynthesis glycosyltransferase